MKLPNFKRLYEQDYSEDYKDLIRTLAVSLNSGFENLYDALNNKITLKDNIACTIKEITLRVDSNGNPKSKTVFPISSSITIEGCQVIKAVNNTKSTTYPTGGIFVSYTQKNDGLEINNITGLVSDNEYTVKIIAYHQ